MSKEYPEWVRQKAADLCNEYAIPSGIFKERHFKSDALNSISCALLKLIEEHYPAPVDEDLILARKVAAENCHAFYVDQTLSGEKDHTWGVKSALAAIKAVRGQATEQESAA